VIALVGFIILGSMVLTEVVVAARLEYRTRRTDAIHGAMNRHPSGRDL
jgi:hypothetical protein